MAYRDRYTLENLRVRAYLRAGVVCDRWLPLDGILLYQSHRDRDGRQDITLPGAYSAQGPATLPLGIANPGRKIWYYQCSWAQWSHDVEGQDHWNKRFDAGFADLVDFRGRRGSVNNAAGEYKAYHMPIYYRAALFVEWFCVGDRAEIEYLLCNVTHLGKKPAQGWGRVSRWEIRAWPEDWSVWRAGQLMRGVPVEALAQEVSAFPLGTNIALYGVRPSYWNKGNQMLLAMPK